MKIFPEDIKKLKEKLNYDNIFLPVEDTVRVRYHDGEFSFWRKNEFGKMFRLGMRYYSPTLDKHFMKYSFLALTDFQDGVCTIVDKEKNLENKGTNQPQFEDTIRYAVFKNGSLQKSLKFYNAYTFKEGIGRVENYEGGCGGTYSYVTVDKNKNFVYLPGKYSYAEDFKNGVAIVKTKVGILQLINKQGEVIDENYTKTLRLKRQREVKQSL